MPLSEGTGLYSSPLSSTGSEVQDIKGQRLRKCFIYLRQSTSREHKDANASQIVQSCHSVKLWPILLKGCAFLPPPESIDSALAFLNPGSDNNLFVGFQLSGYGPQIISSLGLNLLGHAADLG